MKITKITLTGIVACTGVYYLVFIYLQLSTFSNFGNSKRVDSYSKIENDEISLKPDNIDNQGYNGGEVNNTSRDMNDERAFSDENWSENTYEGNPEDRAKEVEQAFFDETGGKEQREELLREHQARIENNRKNDNSSQSLPVSENQRAGNVMVAWELRGRKAYKNDNWYVRNPGYTCGYNSAGTVEVQIKVNRSGRVIDAEVVNSSSSASSCMKRKAIDYARKSRFNYAPNSETTQTGIIRYTFVSQ